MEMEKQKIVKITVVGGVAVGKTSLVQSYIGNGYSDTYSPMVSENVIKWADNYDLLICDTVGQEDYSRLRSLGYPGTHVFIVCFSLNNHHSYEDVTEFWYEEVNHFVPNAPLVLVGTKLDDTNRQVTHQKGVELQEAIGAAFYVECSAKDGTNINDVFDSAMKAHFAAKNKKRKARSCAFL